MQHPPPQPPAAPQRTHDAARRRRRKAGGRPSRRSSRLFACAGALVMTMCLLLAAAAFFALSLPGRAAALFGPPAAGTSALQRVTLSAQLLAQAGSLTRPAAPGGAAPAEAAQPFEIELGESTFQITERLQQDGLIPNAAALRTYLRYSGLDTSLQAGEFELSPALTPVEIARALQDATPTRVRFTILPGWRLEEIAAAIPTSGFGFSGEDFLAAAAAPPASSLLVAELPAGAGVQGFLLPDLYDLPREAAPGELIQAAVDNFAAKADADLRGGFERQGLSLFQAVTLAAIVEREAVLDDEMPMIASVFLNRLAAGIKLDSDPTAQYAVGFNSAQNTWWTNPLSLADLQVDSPYNTYLYPGLPPGPIANPGLNALRAVAFPAQTPYYYFRAACDGSGAHQFSETYEEHLTKGCP